MKLIDLRNLENSIQPTHYYNRKFNQTLTVWWNMGKRTKLYGPDLKLHWYTRVDLKSEA